ncbi:hypothetical protein G7046_g3499 [Stylonectria norvegica]|nr:hypothetical protein G7046_g3499 [Stylonectria norvegica]
MRLQTVLPFVAAQIAGTAAQASGNGNVIYQLSNNSEFAFILEETLSLANNFGANTGEVLRAASQIIPGDYESWYREFFYLANSIHEIAEGINATRNPVSAREAYFRSATYYREADFFLHGNISDPRIYSLWNSALADFDSAIALLPVPGVRVNITAENGNFTVPIIYYGAEDSRPFGPGHGGKEGRHGKKEKLPTIIAGTGYDGAQEELYHQMGRAAVDRGWNFITYEGPGQPTVRRQQNLGFIPNWWDVVTPVVDYLETRDDVDMDRIALYGVSFGGTLAPIAASREHRLAAVLAIDGIISLGKAIKAELPAQLLAIFDAGNATEFDEVMIAIERNASMPTSLRWAIAQSTFAFDTASPFDWLTRLGDYVADKPVLDNITAPVFVGAASADTTAPGQAEEMAAILGEKATYMQWKKELGAGEHCSLGAEAQLVQVTLDWLYSVFEGETLPRNLTAVKGDF